MLTFFIIDSIWWWIAFSTFGGVFLYGGIRENGWVLLIDLIIYILLLQWVFNAPIFKTIFSNPGLMLSLFVGYFVVGTSWSFFKWYMRVSDFAKEFIKKKEKWVQGKIDKMSDPYSLDEYMNEKWDHAWDKEWKSYKKAQYFMSDRPLAKESKSDICFWIGYWPVSVIVFFFEDFIRRIIETIVEKFKTIYERIENKVYKDLK